MATEGATMDHRVRRVIPAALAGLLVCALAIASFTVTAFAQEGGDDAGAVLSAQEVNIAKGQGWRITWNGTLVIFGELPKWDDTDDYAPWHEVAGLITAATTTNGARALTCRGMFRDCENMETVDLSNLDTSNVTDMSGMFDTCTHLKQLDISHLDSSNVTDMSFMFCNCWSLVSIDLSGLVTSQVMNMKGMFNGCSVPELDLSGFDTAKVTNMAGMLRGCDAAAINVDGWNTSQVTDMNQMFFGCENLKSIDLSGFNTSSVTRMDDMFYSCSALTSLDLSGFDTSSVIEMSNMFKCCTSLAHLNVSGWDTSHVKHMCNMFEYCKSLASLDLSDWDTSQVTSMAYMFSCCELLKTLDLSSWDTSSLEGARSMFESCKSLTMLNIGNWDVANVEDMYNMFTGCFSITSIDVSEWDVSGALNMWEMFSYCHSLRSLDLSKWNVSSVRNLGRMFADCDHLLSLDVSGWETPNHPDTWDMFEGCDSLAKITVGAGFPTSQSFPAATSFEKRWWSSNDGCWYTVEEIQSDRCDVADTYLSAEGATPLLIRYSADDSELFNYSLEWYMSIAASWNYSPDLARLAAALSCAAYDDEWARDAFTSLGFPSPLQHYEEGPYAAYSISVKDSEDGKVALVVFRGTSSDSLANQLQNITLGDSALKRGSWHLGFWADANVAFKDLELQLGGSIPESGVRYFVTGHSQGAAAANIVEMMLSEAGVPKEDVYGYNIACPDTGTAGTDGWGESESHNNIFNIGNSRDPITYLPGAAGDFLGGIASVTSRMGDITPGSWGKHGRSMWFAGSSDGWEGADCYDLDFSFGAHDQKAYLARLREASTLKFKSYGEMVLGKITSKSRHRFFCTHCPVDVIVKDASGEVVASVVGGEVDYHGHDFGEVLIMVQGDEKLVAVPDDGGYSVELKATDSGTMTFVDSVADVCGGQTESSKTFENVSLFPGKEMEARIVESENTDNTLLFVTDDSEPVALVAEDGTESALRDIEDASVVFHGGPWTYDGKPQEPDITLLLDESIGLTESAGDFSTEFSNNINAGTASIAIKGHGVYTGTKTVTFEIAPRNLEDAEVSLLESSYIWDGTAREPDIKVTLDDGLTTLVKNTDYELTYRDNVNVGTATVTVTGKGNYVGNKPVAFTIKAASSSGSGASSHASDSSSSASGSGGSGSGSGGSTPTPSAPSASRVTMYRVYNPNSGEHFYTASTAERDSVVAAGWVDEGEGWVAPSTSSTPVYRLYSGTDHHYTTSAEERDKLISVGWVDEGIGWYSDDAQGTPLYRQFNPNVDPHAARNNSGSHNYTASKGENDYLASIGWVAEGIGWYGMA